MKWSSEWDEADAEASRVALSRKFSEEMSGWATGCNAAQVMQNNSSVIKPLIVKRKPVATSQSSAQCSNPGDESSHQIGVYGTAEDTAVQRHNDLFADMPSDLGLSDWRGAGAASFENAVQNSALDDKSTIDSSGVISQRRELEGRMLVYQPALPDASMPIADLGDLNCGRMRMESAETRSASNRAERRWHDDDMCLESCYRGPLSDVDIDSDHSSALMERLKNRLVNPYL